MHIILGFFALLHFAAADQGHPINCVTNPTEAVCEYKLNK